MFIQAPRQKLLAASLSCLLVACSATRPQNVPPAPTGPRDLAKYALILQKMPDGRIQHEWKPLDALDWMKSEYDVSTKDSAERIVRVSSTGLMDYCEGRREQCEEDCLASHRPIWVGTRIYDNVKVMPWREAKTWWCPRNCMELADMCRRGIGSWAEDHAAEFSSIGPAVDWLKDHREALRKGAVIIIAGVTFVAAVAASGGGALILVPLVLIGKNIQTLPATLATAEAH